MLAKLRAQFYWPSYHSDVRNCCRMCPQCVARKAPSPQSRVPLTSTQAGLPMQMFGVAEDNFNSKTKAFYDKRVHGIPFAKGDLVWFHSPVPKNGIHRKIHKLWTGTYHIVCHLSDAIYRIQHTPRKCLSPL